MKHLEDGHLEDYCICDYEILCSNELVLSTKPVRSGNHPFIDELPI